MNSWDAIYTNIADANPGKTLTRAQVLALVVLAGGRTGSQGPTDYRGQLDANGNVSKAGTQTTQYRPILFVGSGDSYTVLPKEKRVLKPQGVRASVASLSSLTPDQLLAALKTAGINVPGMAVTAPAVPKIDPAVASASNGKAIAPASVPASK